MRELQSKTCGSIEHGVHLAFPPYIATTAAKTIPTATPMHFLILLPPPRPAHHGSSSWPVSMPVPPLHKSLRSWAFISRSKRCNLLLHCNVWLLSWYVVCRLWRECIVTKRLDIGSCGFHYNVLCTPSPVLQLFAFQVGWRNSNGVPSIGVVDFPLYGTNSLSRLLRTRITLKTAVNGRSRSFKVIDFLLQSKAH